MIANQIEVLTPVMLRIEVFRGVTLYRCVFPEVSKEGSAFVLNDVLHVLLHSFKTLLSV